MINLEATLDVAALRGNLDGFRQRDINFATARAVTETAATVAYQMPRELLPRIFHRPTQYTLNAFRWTRVRSSSGKDTSTTARVELKNKDNSGGKGVPQVAYLLPQIEGGPRRAKSFEKSLRAVGVMPPGMFAVPTRFIKHDSYGNPVAGELVRILSYFRALTGEGSSKNLAVTRRTGGKKTGRDISGEESRWKSTQGKRYGYRLFAIQRKRGSGLPPGIYEVLNSPLSQSSQAERLSRLKNVPKNFRSSMEKRIKGAKFSGGSDPRPLLLFVRQPNYRKRFPFFEEAERRIVKMFPMEFEKQLEKAVALAKARGWIT